MFHHRQGAGSKLVLVHGLGSNADSWSPVLDALAEHREVIAVDLPGHGRSPAEPGATSVAGLADALQAFIAEEGLDGVDLVGSSVGGRLVLELARRGHRGAVVALDPGGFWRRPGALYLGATLGASVHAVRLLRPVLPALTAGAAGRTALLVQLSSRPWRVPAGLALAELRSFAATAVFDEVLRQLVRGPTQAGLPAGQAVSPIVIGWGRRDRVTFRRQAHRAARRFPDARLHWFRGAGHFPHVDRPAETVELILDATGGAHPTIAPPTAG